MTLDSTPLFCSDQTQQANAQLAGSAPAGIRIWLLLEYAQPWAAKALPASDLPDAVKARLGEIMTRVPDARFQFIKRDARHYRGLESTPPHYPLHFFVGVMDEANPKVYHFQLSRYEELLSLDVEALANGENLSDFAEHRYTEPLFLVCTNGKRDRCCSRYGTPLYNAMADYDRATYAGESVWQVDHLGGHRFAATMLALPHGVYYGWLTPEDGPPLIDAWRRGDIYRLDRFRGRPQYASHVQAAEWLLRTTMNGDALALSALRHAGTDEVGDGRWHVQFVQPERNFHHTVDVVRTMHEQPALINCGEAETHETSVPVYTLASVTNGHAEVE